MASLVFVCWGNICRSPIGERVAQAMASERGLDLERGFTRMMDKIETRDADRWTKKDAPPRP